MNTHQLCFFFFLHFYLETSTVQHKNTKKYTIFPTCLISSCLLPHNPLYIWKKTFMMNSDVPQLPTPPTQVITTQTIYTLYSLFTSLLNLSVNYFLEEDLLMGTHCPYGFLSATLSALDVTLLSWSVGLFDGLAMVFCQYKELKSILIFQYTLTVIIIE